MTFIQLKMKVFGLLFIWMILFMLESPSYAGNSKVVNPCCYYPCQNSGICVRFEKTSFQCDCTQTGYYGDNCSIPTIGTTIRLIMKPRPSTVQYLVTHFNWFWDIVNNSFLRDVFMGLVLRVRANLIPSIPTYNSKYGYLNWESYYNTSYYTRILPPVPEDCPVPMGTKGKAVLPDPKVLTKRFFKRTKFRPEPRGTNLMFAFMAQHFTHQFFKTNQEVEGGFTKALGHGVDASNIYGDNLERQHHLRLHVDGKLKYKLMNGELFPPTTDKVPVFMKYPQNVPPEQRLAIGDENFGLVPGLTMYATIWLREHNRICDILKAEHPTWDDEQLFQTTRLIVIGEMIKIIIEEYVQHLTGYKLKLKFDPTLLFEERFQYGNRISLEFNHLYHWHSLMPDSFFINGTEFTYAEFLFNTSILTHYGVEKLVESFSGQPAGQIGGGRNFHESLLGVSEKVIEESRATRIQPFNEYRKRFHLKPYASFSEFTDDVEMAEGLEELYGDIDALEFYPGLMLEKSQPDSIFGPSMLEIGAPFSLKGVMGNPICAPHYWKPSTFGGETGFNIVKTSTLKKLVCLNTKWCPYVAFRVPPNDGPGEQSTRSTEL